VGIDGKKPPTTIEEVEELYSMESFRQDIYQFWGYRFDHKDSDAKKPQAVHDRLLADIPQSLTEQRERLLDLVDAIVGAIVEESCPRNKPPEDWDWKGIEVAFLEHFGRKLESAVDHLNDLEQLAHALYEQAEKAVDEKEKEMGTELLLRVFR